MTPKAMTMCDDMGWGGRASREANRSIGAASAFGKVVALKPFETKLDAKRESTARFFTGCTSDKRFYDPSLCSVEILLVLSLG